MVMTHDIGNPFQKVELAPMIWVKKYSKLQYLVNQFLNRQGPSRGRACSTVPGGVGDKGSEAWQDS